MAVAGLGHTWRLTGEEASRTAGEGHGTPAQDAEAGLLRSYFLTVTSNLLATNAFVFRGGTLDGLTGYYPGRDYHFEYLRDFLFAVRAAPAFFTTRELRQRMEWYASHSVTNAIPDAIGSSPRVGPAYDSQYDFVDLVYQHYRKSGSARGFVAFQAVITNALKTVCIKDHLVWLTNGMIGWGFQDAMKKHGYETMSSVLRYRACQQLSEMAAAAEQSGESAAWQAELPLIRESLRSNLWDASTGLYYNTSGTNLHSVPASAYAVVMGACDEPTSLAISRKLADGLPGGLDALAGKGFSDYGAIKMFPRNEVPAGTYQWGGYWPAFAGWVAAAVELTDPEKASQLLNSLASSIPFPGTTLCAFEWFNSAVKAGAENWYLASAAGPALYIPGRGSRGLKSAGPGISLANVVLVEESTNATPFLTRTIKPISYFVCYTNLDRRAIATAQFAFDATMTAQTATGDFAFSVETFQPGTGRTNLWVHSWTNRDPRQRLRLPLTFWLSPGDVYVFNCQPAGESGHGFKELSLMLGYE